MGGGDGGSEIGGEKERGAGGGGREGRGNIHAYIQCNVVSLIRGVVLAIGSNVKPVQTGRLD